LSYFQNSARKKFFSINIIRPKLNLNDYLFTLVHGRSTIVKELKLLKWV